MQWDQFDVNAGVGDQLPFGFNNQTLGLEVEQGNYVILIELQQNPSDNNVYFREV